MKLAFTAILFILCTTSLFAQNVNTVKGTVVDTSSKIKLVNTTICVLNAKDSIMRKFTYAKEGGAFTISNLPSGNFILLVSYPNYADYVEKFTLSAAQPGHNFGTINMQLKSKLLHDVIIKGEVNAIKIKGDTTEFNAKAYVIQPNDKVEDLLKQLPGIQVDKDGKITANGQAVNKVLVDGEEFFGDDPTLVTKNLRADMVDKVQVFDKKSDQAAFTGVDDGKKTRTINIKLKEDKKNGTFGKLDGGIGTKDYYESQAIYNRFKAKQKYSAYGTSANDGKTGLGFADNTNLGSSGNNVEFIDGGIYITGSGGSDGLDSYNGTYDGRGKPLAHSGGLHFDSKWSGDNQSINTNYKIGSIDVKGNTNTITQLNLSTGKINTNSNQTFDNYAFRQKLDATYLIKIDTTATLKVSADATFRNFRVDNNYITESTNDSSMLINRNNRVITNHGNQQLVNASALYTKKFKKVGRTLSWNVAEAYNQNSTKGYLNSEVDYFNVKTGARDSVQLTNQYKTSDVTSSVLNSNITYSEPLTKKFAVLLNYGLNINNSTADRKSFDQSAPGVYDILNTTYSNDYKFNQLINQVGAIFNYKGSKFIYNFGTKVSDVNYKQLDRYTGNVFRRDFLNWTPQAMFQYKPSLQKSFTINYNGYNTQPTIDQIQPVRVNTDPLNITLGNADLKPSFTHSMYANYNASKVLSGANTYLYGYFSFTTNAIVNSTVTDQTSGKSTIQYVNISGKSPYNYSLYASSNRKIKAINTNIGLGLNSSGSVSYNYINNALNMSKSFNYSASLSISRYEAKKSSFSIYAGPQYTVNRFSLQSESNNNAAGFNASGYGTYYFPKKFFITTDIRYTYTAKTQVFDALNRTVWNASLNKSFFKDDNLTLSLTANDLLNQNRNFNRRITGNTLTQTDVTSIRRYFMFTVIWNFTKFGTVSEKK